MKKAGATVVVPETIGSGLQLPASVLTVVGMDEGTAARVIQIERD
jgi:hypothetical protein